MIILYYACLTLFFFEFCLTPRGDVVVVYYVYMNTVFLFNSCRFYVVIDYDVI